MFYTQSTSTVTLGRNTLIFSSTQWGSCKCEKQTTKTVTSTLPDGDGKPSSRDTERGLPGAPLARPARPMSRKSLALAPALQPPTSAAAAGLWQHVLPGCCAVSAPPGLPPPSCASGPSAAASGERSGRSALPPSSASLAPRAAGWLNADGEENEAR